MKVFIENEAGSNLKNLYDEKTLVYKETIQVSRTYPYPYGFILNTTNEDGDNVDVFVLTNKKLQQGQIVEVEIIGLMEQFEKAWHSEDDREEIDHNIISKLPNEDNIKYNQKVKQTLKEFVLHVFDHIRLNKTRVGKFYNQKVAIDFIQKNRDKD